MSPNRMQRSATTPKASTSNDAPYRMKLCAILLLSVLLLVGGGLSHRWVDDFLMEAEAPLASLETPLSSLPLRIGPWRGVDVPLSKTIIEIAKADDHVHRRYVHQSSGQIVDFHLAYAGRPINVLGHRPRVCYPAHGWTHAETKATRVRLANNEELACSIHEFTRNQPVYQGMVVLNYYVIQGRYTSDHYELWRMRRRFPTRSRDAGMYAAQVQVSNAFMDPSASASAEAIVRRFIVQAVEHVAALLPGTGITPSPRQ
jgi:EpsI family protein